MESLKLVNSLEQLDVEMSREEYEKIRDSLEQYINESGRSQSKIAKEIGFSSAAISQFLNGNYPGNMANMCFAVEKYLTLQKQRLEAPKRPEFVMTEIADEIMTVCNFAQINNDMGMVLGDPGIGKTMTLRKFAEENPNVEYICASPTTKSPNAFLDELLDVLGKQEKGTAAAKQRACIKILKGSGKMLIIDEAQHLTRSSIETIRAIYDATKIPIVLAGNPIVFDQMGGGRKIEFAQFFSRIGIRRILTGNRSKNDVRMIVEQCVTDPSEEIIEFLSSKANGKGGFRWMEKHLVLGMTLAYQKKEPVTIEHLHKAERILEG